MADLPEQDLDILPPYINFGRDAAQVRRGFPVVDQTILTDVFALSPSSATWGILAAACLRHVVIENLDCNVRIAVSGQLDDDWLTDLRLRAAAHVPTPAGDIAARQNPPAIPKLVVIGGLAGSGKTEIGQRLARQLGWVFFDKDSLTRRLVESRLELAGSTPNDRESVEYVQHIRPLEYRALEETAMLNLRRGCSCVLAAPYVRELRSPEWYADSKVAVEGAGAQMIVVWAYCDADTMLLQLTNRGAARDDWKLAHWDEYLQWAEPARRPVKFDVEVDNSRAPGEALPSQILRLAGLVRS